MELLEYLEMVNANYKLFETAEFLAETQFEPGQTLSI